MAATAPRLVTLIREDLDVIGQGDAVLSQIRGKAVKSHLQLGTVSVYNRQTQTTKNIRLEKPQILTGEIHVLSGKDDFAFVKTKDGLWLDVSYLEMATLPKKQDNTALYVLGAFVLYSMFSK